MTTTSQETVHEAQERRAAEAFGLRPSRAAICPRTVAGGRCRAWHSGEPCICMRHRHLLDHGRIWLDEAGRYVLTGEPYDAHGEDVADLLADLAALGLRATFTGRSLWYPGYTLLIVIRPEENPLSTPENPTLFTVEDPTDSPSKSEVFP